MLKDIIVSVSVSWLRGVADMRSGMIAAIVRTADKILVFIFSLLINVHTIICKNNKKDITYKIK